ncbi:MAG TPA: class I SAM-dependent methyltransferase [Selenomonadales bacterium]|nr:class I SAM-dependent methyltransferase [Selenomonadales bacterium]
MRWNFAWIHGKFIKIVVSCGKEQLARNMLKKKIANPWKDVKLDDYENHMKLASVKQLQTMNEIMRDQFYRYEISSVMVLGVAGGNGLNHIVPDKFRVVYGVDINAAYLEEAQKRYPLLQRIFRPIQADLTDGSLILPQADLVIANLLIEYIGYDNFQRTIGNTNPEYVSCIIQINLDDGFVSDSPYLHAFDHLGEVHHPIAESKLTEKMNEIGYKSVFREQRPLPNGKEFLRLDYIR